MSGEEREDRENLLHRWVAEGKVEFRNLASENYTAITEYRVVGCTNWYDDRKRLSKFPSVQLIARLQIDMVVFQPEVRRFEPTIGKYSQLEKRPFRDKEWTV